ncbi:MAG: RluA family pseudouridine synthase [Clostridiales bacterium]|nr:RluA family pseudouridine synthase [Clostridiales bacterium]MCR5273801.1 RluA family pseudouridine synthase [Clostridiales bacterium]
MIESYVVENYQGRVDAYIPQACPDLTRSRAAQLIADGAVTVDGKPVKASFKVFGGETIDIDFPPPVDTDAKPENIPLDIVYEDDDLIIINKPQGMVVHPAPGHYSGTLVNALLYHCAGKLSDINGVIRPGIVHRIDMDTSGLMVAVKNNETHLAMADMIAKHEVVREYRACVYGIVDSDKGTIHAPIGRATNDRRKMTVCENGKDSITHFQVLERFRKGTDLLCRLETGRTHQIRAHMTYIGHPCIGDPLYAPKREKYNLHGQALHSTSIRFIHPRTEELIDFKADIPEHYQKLLELLRNDV